LIVAVVWSELGQWHAAVDRIGRIFRADPAHAERVAQAVRSANDRYLIADLHAARVTEGRDLNAGGYGVQLEEGEVGRGLGCDHPRCNGLAPEELHGDLVHGVHDVGGRHHFAIGRDQHAGADLAVVRDAGTRRDFAPFRANHDHRRADLSEQSAEVLSLYGPREQPHRNDRHQANDSPHEHLTRREPPRAHPRVVLQPALGSSLTSSMPWIGTRPLK
jgi:hypothetical protein